MTSDLWLFREIGPVDIQRDQQGGWIVRKNEMEMRYLQNSNLLDLLHNLKDISPASSNAPWVFRVRTFNDSSEAIDYITTEFEKEDANGGVNP